MALRLVEGGRGLLARCLARQGLLQMAGPQVQLGRLQTQLQPQAQGGDLKTWWRPEEAGALPAHAFIMMPAAAAMTESRRAHAMQNSKSSIACPQVVKTNEHAAGQRAVV